MRQFIKNGIVLLAAVALVGCQDLLVDNKNSPDRHRALSQPDAVELLVASTFQTFYNRSYRGTAGYIPSTMVGDESTNSNNTSGGRDISEIPRLPFNNNPVTANEAFARLYWGDFYEVLANTTDVLKVINGGLRIVTNEEDNTERARMFSKLSQGMALGYIALLYDRGFIMDENTPDEHLQRPMDHLELLPYGQVMDKALSLLDEAEALAQGQPDVSIPSDWMYSPSALEQADVLSMIHAYRARFQVLLPRSPQEREAVDWNAVLADIDQVTRDVEIEMQSGARNNHYFFYTQHPTTGRRLMAHVRLYGQADTSGAYQDWVATPPNERERFLVETPDRRLTGETPEEDGSRFAFNPTTNVDRIYGGHRESYYQFNGHGGEYQAGVFAQLPLKELRLYAAEAHYRLGQPELTAQIVNETRIANGQLPPVTVDGVPEGAECVPRMEDGTCGSLWDAMVYERMMELSYIEPTRTWLDRRGLGTLYPGSIVHLPLPASQLEILGIPLYTFGGVGNEGSAP